MTISPSALTGRGLEVRSDTCLAAPPPQDIWLRQAELEMSYASEELPKGTGQNDVEIELTVIYRGMLCDGKATAVITTIADANLIDCA